MASCAAGKTSRVYDQHMELMCKFMVRTWGHLFKANEKKNMKNTCEPSKIYIPSMEGGTAGGSLNASAPP